MRYSVEVEGCSAEFDVYSQVAWICLKVVAKLIDFKQTNIYIYTSTYTFISICMCMYERIDWMERQPNNTKVVWTDKYNLPKPKGETNKSL